MNTRTLPLHIFSLATSFAFFASRIVFADVDDSYRKFAVVLSSPIHENQNDLTRCYDDNALILRLEIARQTLNMSHTIHPSLNQLKLNASRHLEECKRSLDRQRSLGSQVPDFEGIVSKTINAAPGLNKVVQRDTESLSELESQALAELATKAVFEIATAIGNAYEISQEKTNYRENFRALRKEIKNQFTQITREQYANVPYASSDALSVDLQGSLDSYYTEDWLEMRNISGKTLTDCTLIVTTTGWHNGSSDLYSETHVHYVNSWSPGTYMTASYPSQVHTGIASNISIDVIQTVRIDLFSDELRDNIEYTYHGDNYDNDLKAKMEKIAPSFYGSWYRYDTNYFLNDGWNCHFTGAATIPASHVRIRASNGSQEVAIVWNLKSNRFAPGSSNSRFFQDERFQAIRPNNVEMDFYFPHSDYVYSINWDEVTIRK